VLLYILRVLDYDWRLIAAPMGYSTSPNEPRSTPLLGTIRVGTFPMNVSLDWSSDVLLRLTDEAQKRGLSLEGYFLHLALEKKAANGTLAGADTQKRLAREEAGRHIREAREGTIFGPELTIRDLIEEGRGAE
jgi:hypothetical protein